MTPESLEYEIRKLEGVLACSITDAGVTVLASPSGDAAAILADARTLVSLAGLGLEVQVIGGVGAPVAHPFAHLRTPAAAGAAVGVSSLLAAAVATALTGGLHWVPGVSDPRPSDRGVGVAAPSRAEPAPAVQSGGGIFSPLPPVTSTTADPLGTTGASVGLLPGVLGASPSAPSRTALDRPPTEGGVGNAAHSPVLTPSVTVPTVDRPGDPHPIRLVLPSGVTAPPVGSSVGSTTTTTAAGAPPRVTTTTTATTVAGHATTTTVRPVTTSTTRAPRPATTTTAPRVVTTTTSTWPRRTTTTVRPQFAYTATSAEWLHRMAAHLREQAEELRRRARALDRAQGHGEGRGQGPGKGAASAGSRGIAARALWDKGDELERAAAALERTAAWAGHGSAHR